MTVLRWLMRFLRYVGRRGAFLLFLGQVDFTLAYAIAGPLPLGLSPDVVYHPFTVIAPLHAWIVAWVTVGVVVTAAAFWKPLQPAGFGFATLIKSVWASGYLIGWREHDALYVRGYQTASLIGALAAVTLLIAWWRENGT